MDRTKPLLGLLGATMAAMAVAFAPAAAGQDSMRAEIDMLKQRLDVLSKQANEPDRSSSKWHMSGYMDAGLEITDRDNAEDSFVAGHFNPAFHFQYKDRVFFESEIEMATEEDGSTEVALEYSAVNVILGDHATLVVGKWLSPVGQFQERLHPTWINKFASAPVGFGHGGIQPLSDVGVQLRGAIPAGGTYFTYVVAVGNGPQGGHHGPELEGFGADNNSDKAVQGRLGFFPSPNFEVGVSFLQGSLPGEPADTGPVTDADIDLYGVDAAYTKANWDVRVEYLNAEMTDFFGKEGHADVATSLIPGTDWTAWYAQVAYRISGSNFEPVIRVGDLDIDGHFEGDGEDQIAVGLNYWMGPSANFRINVVDRSFDEAGAEDETLVQLQFAYGF